MEIKDFSSRRGAIVPLLPKIHAMLKENAEHDKISAPPEHLITWTQKIRKTLLDINWRFLAALNENNLAGIFFYRIDGTDAFIEDVQTALSVRNNAEIIEGFIKRLEFDPSIKNATFFASERVKIESDKEMLAAKGFDVKNISENGCEKLGTFSQACNALKLRYNRSTGV
jgi:hypothetical protein